MLFLVPGLEFCGTYKFKLAKIFLRLFVCSRFTHRIGCCSSFLTFSFSFLFFSEKVTPSPKHTHTNTPHTYTKKCKPSSVYYHLLRLWFECYHMFELFETLLFRKEFATCLFFSYKSVIDKPIYVLFLFL